VGKRILLFVASVLAVGLLSGCVTSKKYRLAKEGAPGPQPLNWRSEPVAEAAPDTALVLETVITYKGPGSWKREAKWDEYVVRIDNPGPAPLVVESAELVDIHSQAQVPGDDPWALEKQSYTNWERYGRSGLNLLAGAGWVTLYGAASVGSALGSMMAGPGAAAAGGGALAVIPVVAVVNITYVVAANHSNKRKVVAEFTRRRLPLPLHVEAGQTKAGSLFFPMTPGPQRLLVKATADGRPVTFTVSLEPMARLHLKPETR
jgi:hypothetical protein